MTQFSVARLIADTLRETDLLDPGKIANEVDHRIHDDDRNEALAQALELCVRYQITRVRVSPPLTAVGNNVGSSRAALTAATWQRALRNRVHVAAGEFKFLAHCDRDDLAFAAAELRDHAARNAARALTYERLVELLAEHGVQTVGDLPQARLADALGGEVA